MKKLRLILILLLFSNYIFSQNYENYKILVDTSLSSSPLEYHKKISVIVPKDWQQNLKQSKFYSDAEKKDNLKELE